MTIKQIAQELERRGIECTVITDSHGHDVIFDLDWDTMKEIADEFTLEIDTYRIRDGHHTYEHLGWTSEPFDIEQLMADDYYDLST